MEFVAVVMRKVPCTRAVAPDETLEIDFPDHDHANWVETEFDVKMMVVKRVLESVFEVVVVAAVQGYLSAFLGVNFLVHSMVTVNLPEAADLGIQDHKHFGQIDHVIMDFD